eukprot:CAMPEP_0197441950 /NCGR_PEP_ID=MMETSP1175-20131217/8081_1 /TAXON_ID=1003142 /ORGANISM="Triceratium dubium, Strain CCMP147" /LENGTH=430 /DNA_ID=CAMNT_0042972325 /DNA_START=451 /DNA_END=1740 /DNA_ORIENTATION=+
MAFKLTVHAIDSPLTDHRIVSGRFRRCEFDFTDEVFRLKEEVEKAFGIPAKDQRYHGLGREREYGLVCGPMFRFDSRRILRDCDDNDSLYAVLQNLYNEEIIDSKHRIAVVRIPIPSRRQKSRRKRSAGEPAAEGSDDSDDSDDDSDDSDNDSDDSDDSDVEVLRDVDTVQERIDAGRDDAIKIGDEEEEEQPPQKRARRANGESEAEPRARRDSNGMEEEEQDQENESANDADELRAENEEAAAARGRNVRAARWGMRASAGPRGSPSELRLWLQGIDDAYRRHANAVDAYAGAFERDGHEIGEEEEADEAEEAKADDEGDEGGNIEARADNEGDDGGDAEAGDAEEAAAAGGEDAQPAAGSELRQWLRGLHADGQHANAFDAYAAAFEREFRTLEDLALAADNAPEGLERIFRACGVRTLGDRARLRW